MTETEKYYPDHAEGKIVSAYLNTQQMSTEKGNQITDLFID